jgi:glutamate---cysteine ligase / carboxylate-amine ligase
VRASERLLAKITPYPGEDTGEVLAGFERLRREGTGADRQRRLWARHGPTPGFVREPAHATTRLAVAS